MFQGVGMSKAALRGKPEFYRVSISTIGVELSKVMGSVCVTAKTATPTKADSS